MDRVTHRAIGFALLGIAAAVVSAGQDSGPSFQVWFGAAEVPSLDAPRVEGNAVIFHRFPDGQLMRADRAAVTSIERVAAGGAATSGSGGVEMQAQEAVVVSASRPPLQPGEVVDLGLTYDTGAFRAPPAEGAPPAKPTVLRPGEGPGGKALLNPDRDYRPSWDSTLIPGYSMAYPNSPNDYREGRTTGYPPGEGRQLTPGAPPTMIKDGGDAPKLVSPPGGWAPPAGGPSTIPPVMAPGGQAPLVPEVHDVPRVSYDPNLPPPGMAPTPAPPKP